MWSPTHVQVLVKKAKGLTLKGKHGTNDAFVTIALGKEKYQTSVKEKATESVEWCEQCELCLVGDSRAASSSKMLLGQKTKTIPSHGNTAEIVLTCLHRNFLGVDEFLGMVKIPLSDFDVYERPRTKWYSLTCKPGQKKSEYRGELEVRTSFTVKAVGEGGGQAGSTADLAGGGGSKKEKHKGSLQSLNKKVSGLGGSLMSLGTKEKKNLKKLAKSVGNKVEKTKDKAKKSLSRSNLSKDKEKDDQPGPLPNKFNMEDSFGRSSSSFQRSSSGRGSVNSRNRDPGVESDEEDEDDMLKFDALSHRSSNNSINVGHHQNLGTVSKTSTPMSGSIDNVAARSRYPAETTTTATTAAALGAGTSSATNSLHRKSFGTPISARKDPPTPSTGASPSGTLRSSRSFLINNDSGSKEQRQFSTSDLRNQQSSLDEWEAKLLGKRKTSRMGSDDPDSRSLVSQGSQKSDRSSLQGPEPPARNNLQPAQETPKGRKKIIPVGSDFESSPSPESPRVPDHTPSSKSTRRSFSSASLRGSVNSASANRRLQQGSLDEDDLEEDIDDVFDKHKQQQQQQQEHKKKSSTIGMKLKSSYSKGLKESGKTKSLFNLNVLGVGKSKKDNSFSKDKDHSSHTVDRRLGSTRDLRESLRVSNESIGKHSRNQSNGSLANNVTPSGPRVVLGRETTPTPHSNQAGQHHNQGGGGRVSRELWDKFEGKTREDLIETILGLQEAVEHQAKKQSDLENYIDSLLTKVIQQAPELLQKNAAMEIKYGARF